MKFSVVTPCYNQLRWLRRCVRSVADQACEGVEVEHIVQDSQSAGISDFGAHSELKIFSEKDRGVYDALNRGFARASGEVVSILNCDEQLLPGALAHVRAIFEKNPGADVVAGDWLIVDARGELLAFRRATKLRASMILTDHLYDFTCAMFFRRDALLKSGVRFDENYRSAGDADFVARLLRAGVRAVCARGFLAAFAITGENLSGRAHAEDGARLRAITPAWARLAAPFLRQWRHVEKLFAGGYRSAPIVYEIFANENDERRTRFISTRPNWRHPWSVREK